MSRSSARLSPCLLLLAAIMLSQIGFFLSVPAFRGIDEFDHAFRASSVGQGHWWGENTVPENGRGYLLPVKASIASAAFEACDALDYTGPDNCSAVTAPDEHGEVQIASAAANYNPVWYAVTGYASRAFDGDTALYVMRITALLMVDALLLSALALARSARRPVGLTAGILLAFTPIVAYSSTNAAPNGATYAAGILLWVSLIRLSEAAAPSRAVFASATVSASVVMATHSTGVMFVPLIVICAIPILWRGRSELWTSSRHRLIISASIIVGVAIACATWVVAAGTNDPRYGEMPTASMGTMPLSTALTEPFLWMLQSIATLVFRNEPAPLAAYGLGFLAIVPVLILGIAKGDRALRTSMLLIGLIGLIVPLILTWIAFSTMGTSWQGRYSLPLTMGLILLAANTLEAPRQDPVPRPLIIGLAVLSIGAHAVTAQAMIASRRGPLDTIQWTALSVGSALAVALVIIGFQLLLHGGSTGGGSRQSALKHSATPTFGASGTHPETAVD